MRFEGGYTAHAGERIVFQEGDSLIAERFLAPNTVLFRYRDRYDRPVSDLICISLWGR